jgi:TetR/AcrR family transcriptional regulator, repressor for uid operon
MAPTSTQHESLLERALADALVGTEAPAVDPAVLDAAFDLFCRLGIQRTTMDDVARAAGISRITLYRRLSSKETLVEQVMLREFRRYIDQFLLDLSGAATAADRVVIGFVSALRAIRDNPLGAALLKGEAAVAGWAMLGPDGSTLAVVRRFVAGQLRLEQAAGTIGGDVDVDLVAELMVRLSTSFVLTPSDLVELDDEARLADIARRYLVPLLGPTG